MESQKEYLPPRTPSSEQYFFRYFAAFASLREVIRDSVAAQSLELLEHSSYENQFRDGRKRFIAKSRDR
jgi:hypothetical protein